MPFHLTESDFQTVVSRYQNRDQCVASKNIEIARAVIVDRKRPGDVAKEHQVPHQRVSACVNKIKALSEVDDWKVRINRQFNAIIGDPELPKGVRISLVKSLRQLGFLK